MTREEKLEAISKVKNTIEKDMGKGVVINLSEKPQDIDVISTGSLGLDIALGVRGFAKGRIIEIYGPESSGKTTIAIHAIAEAQKKGGICAFIDAEHAFDRKYAENLGVKIDDVYICQPESGDQGLEVADRLIASGAFDIVVIDSVAALVPKAELEGEMGESKMGLHARLMSQALRKITASVAKTNCCCIFINQLREKIGVMFGNPETTTGGNALKFYASQRIDVRRSITAANSTTDVNGIVSGNLTKIKVIKNKVAPPFRTCEVDILYGIGIDKLGELIDIAVDLGALVKSGSWYSYEGEKIGQGREAVKTLLSDNPELEQSIRGRIDDILDN